MADGCCASKKYREVLTVDPAAASYVYDTHQIINSPDYDISQGSIGRESDTPRTCDVDRQPREQILSDVEPLLEISVGQMLGRRATMSCNLVQMRVESIGHIQVEREVNTSKRLEAIQADAHRKIAHTGLKRNWHAKPLVDLAQSEEGRQRAGDFRRCGCAPRQTAVLGPLHSDASRRRRRDAPRGLSLDALQQQPVTPLRLKLEFGGQGDAEPFASFLLLEVTLLSHGSWRLEIHRLRQQ